MAGQALSCNRGTLALAVALEEGHRQPGAWPRAPHSGAWKGNLLARDDGVVGQSQSQDLWVAGAEGRGSLAFAR